MNRFIVGKIFKGVHKDINYITAHKPMSPIKVARKYVYVFSRITKAVIR